MLVPTILLSPLALTAEPVRLDIPDFTYSHSTQTSVIKGNLDKRFKLALTMMGTQTYNFQGRPSDNDND